MYVTSGSPSVELVWSSLLLLFGFGCLTGVTTVLFGFGGGFVTVPVVFGMVQASSGADAMHVAVATSTAVMVVNSLTATLAQLRSGRLRKEYVWPMAAFIGIGALLGSLAATAVTDAVLHVLFIVYLGVTIVDSLLRKGFLTSARQSSPAELGRFAVTGGGVGIGVVASFLGVGGSVLTVPLLRRKGLPMAEAATMANPLSAPVAVVATLVYAFAGTGPAQPGRLGSVDLLAAVALLCGSLPTIAIVKRIVGRIPDAIHAYAYIGLLTLVLITMIVTGGS